MADPIPHPVRARVRPHDTHHYLRTDGQRRISSAEWLGRRLRTIFTPFEARRVLYVAGSVRQALSSPGAGHWRTSSPCIHWLQITVELRITSARHEEADAWEGGATLLSTELRAQNHAALEHIDLVVGHGHSGVPLSSSPAPSARSV